MQKRIIIKQRDQKDCGICCLESLIKYYHGYIPLEKIREDTFTNHRGTSAFHMVEALKSYGFDAYGIRLRKEDFFKSSFPMPAIVHVVLDNGLNHYMVLYEKRKEKVVVMDPSFGKKVMSETDFFWIWSEIMIIAYPKEEIKKSEKEDSFLLQALNFCGNNKKNLSRLIYLELFLLFFSIIGTFYLKIALKYLQRNIELYGIILFFAFLILLKLSIIQESNYSQKQLNKKLTALHTTTFIEHLFNLPLPTFKLRNGGEYLTRFWENLELKYLYTDLYKNAIISSITLFGCFSLLFSINNNFFHYFGIVSILYLIFQIYFQSQSYTIEKSLLIEKTKIHEKLLEKILNYEMYYFLNLKKQLHQMLEKDLIAYLEKDEEKNNFYQKNGIKQIIFKELIEFSFITMGIWMIKKQKLTMIDFMIIQMIGFYMLNALTNLANLIPKEKYLKNLLKKADEFLKIPKEKNSNQILFQMGEISFSKVCFTYNQYQYVLKDLSFLIHEKEHVLLFGKSGCGKSTICGLLTRTYIPNSGEIKIGEMNIQDIELNSLKSSIIYLNQNSKLITGTIRENIIVNRSFDFQRFKKICEICHIEEIVSKYPLRYETMISNEERILSGGERQRIRLARTLYTNARVFLFDESLSEVEEKLEKEMIKNIRHFLKDKTIIYISHKNYKNLFDEVIKLEVVNERIIIS